MKNVKISAIVDTSGKPTTLYVPLTNYRWARQRHTNVKAYINKQQFWVNAIAATLVK
jgi:hypothetical protein